MSLTIGRARRQIAKRGEGGRRQTERPPRRTAAECGLRASRDCRARGSVGAVARLVTDGRRLQGSGEAMLAEPDRPAACADYPELRIADKVQWWCGIRVPDCTALARLLLPKRHDPTVSLDFDTHQASPGSAPLRSRLLAQNPSASVFAALFVMGLIRIVVGGSPAVGRSPG